MTPTYSQNSFSDFKIEIFISATQCRDSAMNQYRRTRNQAYIFPFPMFSEVRCVATRWASITFAKVQPYAFQINPFARLT